MQFQTNRCLRSTELHQTILRTWRRAGKYFEGRAIKFVEKKANKQKARPNKRRNRNHQNTQTLNFQGKKGEMKDFICRKGLAHVADESGEAWSRKNHKWWYEQTILPRNLNILDVRAKNVKTEKLGWKMKAAGNRAKIISLRLTDPRSQASKRFFS